MTTLTERLNDSRFSEQDIVHIPVSAVAFLWSRTDMLSEIWHVVQTVGAWQGAEIRPDASGLCLTLDGKTLGHLGWQGRIDLPFGPKVQRHLLAEQMARVDTYQPDANRLVFDIRTTADADRAVWLLRLAYLIEDRQSVQTCN